MKKRARLFVIISLLLCVAFLVAGSVAPAIAKGANAKGAVKMDLGIRKTTDPWDVMGTAGPVGWASANTNDNGQLIVRVHVHKGKPNTTFDVYVKINNSWHAADLGSLTTNGQGNGNVHLVLNIADYVASPFPATIDVQVVVKVTIDGPDYSTDKKAVPVK